MKNMKPEKKIDISLMGVSFSVIPNTRSEYDFWTRFNAGRWESDTLNILSRHVNRAVHFLDIGGWIGPTALFAAGLGASVTVIEADPVAIASLEANIGCNPALADRIHVVKKAIAPTNSPIRFGSRSEGGDSTSSIVHDQMKTAWYVDAITPREVADLCPKITPVFVKIDIEGSEYLVLPQAKELFSLPLAGLLLSLHPQFLIGQSTGRKRLSRWMQAAEATGNILRQLEHLRFYKCSKLGPINAKPVKLLARQNMCWPLRRTWLFLPDVTPDHQPTVEGRKASDSRHIG